MNFLNNKCSKNRNTNSKNILEMVFLDSKRAHEIIKSNESIQVLYQGTPVWLESVKDNNVAAVTRMDKKDKIEVPVYMLVENSPAKT